MSPSRRVTWRVDAPLPSDHLGDTRCKLVKTRIATVYAANLQAAQRRRDLEIPPMCEAQTALLTAATAVQSYVWYANKRGSLGVNKDPRISPLRMETEVLQALPPTTMYVGTEEILLPGNLLLYQRAVDIGAP